MQGMFRANGGCGYIKKPDILLKGGSDSDIFDPKATLPVKTTLRVRDSSGLCLVFSEFELILYHLPR